MICACVLTIFEFNLRSSSWSTLIFAPWLILMHNYMYMAFIPNPFNILLASPMEQTFLYNLMSLFLQRNFHSLWSLNAYIDVDGFHPPIHPIFFMHCKWNFPSNVYLSANISPLGLSFNYQNHTWGLQVLSPAQWLASQLGAACRVILDTCQDRVRRWRTVRALFPSPINLGGM